VLKANGDFVTMLIGAEGARLPREEASRNTRGKRSAWSVNQQASLTQPNRKAEVLKMQKKIRCYFKQWIFISSFYARWLINVVMEEEEGFEPPRGMTRLSVFKTDPFSQTWVFLRFNTSDNLTYFYHYVKHKKPPGGDIHPGFFTLVQ
jgi:hypothetical protein